MRKEEKRREERERYLIYRPKVTEGRKEGRKEGKGKKKIAKDAS